MGVKHMTDQQFLTMHFCNAVQTRVEKVFSELREKHDQELSLLYPEAWILYTEGLITCVDYLNKAVVEGKMPNSSLFWRNHFSEKLEKSNKNRIIVDMLDRFCTYPDINGNFLDRVEECLNKLSLRYSETLLKFDGWEEK